MAARVRPELAAGRLPAEEVEARVDETQQVAPARPRRACDCGRADVGRGRSGGDDRTTVVRHARAGRGRRPARRNEPDRPGRQLPAHPVLRDRVHARRDPGREPRRPHVGRGLRPFGRRAADVPGHDQPAGDKRPAQGVPELAEAPRRRAGRPGEGTETPRPVRERLQGPDLHPERDPRERIRGRRRDDAAHQPTRDDAVRHRSLGRQRPRPRDRRRQHRPEPGRPGRGNPRQRQRVRPQPRLPHAVAARGAGVGRA